jgi:hypothetical protein
VPGKMQRILMSSRIQLLCARSMRHTVTAYMEAEIVEAWSAASRAKGRSKHRLEERRHGDQFKRGVDDRGCTCTCKSVPSSLIYFLGMGAPRHFPVLPDGHTHHLLGPLNQDEP